MYLYRTCTPSYGIDRKRLEAQPYILCRVFLSLCVGCWEGNKLLRLLAPLPLMGGKGADLTIHGNVVLNKSKLLHTNIFEARDGHGKLHSSNAVHRYSLDLFLMPGSPKDLL
jgi:hypothetical protein